MTLRRPARSMPLSFLSFPQAAVSVVRLLIFACGIKINLVV
jgi:hypothetical protein